MFIANATLKDDTTLIMLGLSHLNIERLLKGQPISLSRESHGMPIPKNLKIMIFAAEDEDRMRQQMSPFIGPTTVLDQKKPQ